MERRAPVVDLTTANSARLSDSDSSSHYISVPEDPHQAGPSSSRPGYEPRELRGTKRRRLGNANSPNSLASSSINANRGSEVNDSATLFKVLAKQREDAIKAQNSPMIGGHLISYKCPVCMDTPVDATTTICGHLFCHRCIINTLRFSEEQRSDGSGKGPSGNCPVCRKPLSWKRNLIPLRLKLMAKKKDASKDVRYLRSLDRVES